MAIVVLIIGGIEFYFNRSEFEAPHVHIRFENRHRKVFLLSMKVRAVRNMKKDQVRKVLKIVEENRELFLRRWKDEIEEKKND